MAEVLIVWPGTRFAYASASPPEADFAETETAGAFSAETFHESEDSAAQTSIDSNVSAGHVYIDTASTLSGEALGYAGLTNHIFDVTTPAVARIQWSFTGSGYRQGGMAIQRLGQVAMLVLTEEDGPTTVTLNLEPGRYVFSVDANVAAGAFYGALDSSFSVQARLDVSDVSAAPALSGASLAVLAFSLAALGALVMRERSASSR